MKIINLGNNCVIALILNLLNLRIESLPFDWIIVDTFKNLINIFEDNFNNFINLDLLKIKTKGVMANPEIFKNTSVKTEPTNNYINKKFNIEFMHDFPSNKDINEVYSDIYNKYKRRIERMFNILRGDELITFILYYPDLSNDKILKFKEILKNINLNMKYNLCLITNNKKIINNKINKVFYIEDNVSHLNLKHYNDNNLRKFFYNNLQTQPESPKQINHTELKQIHIS